MEPTVTIIEYLYRGRNTWLRHGEDCVCDIESRIQEVLDQLPVEEYTSIDGPNLSLLLKTEAEWSDVAGPEAEKRILDRMVEEHMSAVSDILAAQATKERLRSE